VVSRGAVLAGHTINHVNIRACIARPYFITMAQYGTVHQHSTVINANMHNKNGRMVCIYLISLVCTISLGSAYSWSAFSQTLSSKLNFTQSQLEAIVATNNAASNFGPIPGLLVAVIAPWKLSLAAATLGFLGFLANSRAAALDSNLVFLQNYVVYAIFYGLVGLASTILYYSVLQTNVHNIPPRYRGLGLATIVAVYGLSASLFTLIYNAAFESDDVAGFLLFSALLLGAMGILASFGLRKLPVINAVEPQVHPLDSSQNQIIYSTNDIINHNSDTIPLIQPLDNDLINSSSSVSPEPIEVGFSIVIPCLIRLIRHPGFWLLLCTFFLISSGGYMQINNISALIESLNEGAQDHGLTLRVIFVLSLANCAGRLSIGSTDFLPIRRGNFLILSAFLMLSGHLLNYWVVSSKYQIYGPTVLIGFAYGQLWALAPIITAELFGSVHFAVNFGWICCAPAVATFTINLIAGAMYSAQIPAGGEQGGNHKCVGKNCFQQAFLLAAGLAAAAIISAAAFRRYTDIGKKATSLQSNLEKAQIEEN
jgi:hypothetical protein